MTTTATTLLGSQLATGNSIAKAWTNLTKLGEANFTVEVIKQRLNQLDNYWKHFYEKHQQIYVLYEDLKDDTYFTNDYFSAVEDEYLSTKGKMTTKLATLIGALQVPPPLPVNDTQGPSLSFSTTASSLPKLTLPRFNGRQEDWESFKELFCSMVKDVPTLTPVLKLQHLLSCLDGDPARRLCNIQVIGANFDVAWTTLENRYDNKRLRLAVQLNRLLSMPAASSKSPAEMNRLMDTTNECRRALRSLQRPVDSWDDWFVQLIVYNLDPVTREDWEKSLEGIATFPTYAALTSFLDNRVQSLETAHCSDSPVQHSTKATVNQGRSGVSSTRAVSAHVSTTSAPKRSSKFPGCLVCQGEHYIGYCPSLLQKSINKRLELVQNLSLCTNCLRKAHSGGSCPSKSRCRHCNQEHHTALHQDSNGASTAAKGDFMPTGPKPALGRPNTLAAHSTALGRPTLIGTAKIILQSKSGLSRTFRALIDPGSEGSFVTEEVVQALSLHKTACETTVTGVGGHTTATSRSTTVVALKSPLDPALFVTFSAVVLSRLSSLLPPQAVCCEPLEHLRGLELADPGYATPGAVDCILGADLYPVLIQEGLRRGSPTMPIAQQTKLGWILTGPAAPRSSAAPTTLQACHTQLSISDQLRRFWEIEEVAMPPVLTKEEEECELIFQRTHSRDSQGRYVVRLPFKAGPTLHNARTMAVSRLLALERKLTRDPPLGQAYRQFLLDYEELGHMERLPDDAAGSASYYLPHHAVVGRKLRVVFDAQELNQILLVGPKLQREITTILIRWRLFRYVFTADIVKMFRQIQMHADDAAWQCILWRATPELPIQEYRLRTVTYGTSCAPYLALRVLLQLAEDEGPTFPRGAQILRRNFYVDDALTGADTLDAAQLAKDELRQILLRAGMTLDKWSANDPALLEDVESAAPSPVRSFDGDDVVSTLGLRWSPHLDAFLYQVQCPSHTTAITKRTILGEIARLYDPLGLLAPVTVRAKILLQALWITGKDWDTPVDAETRRHWEDFRQQLPLLEHLRVPRWFGTTSSSTVQIHGFSDASEKAYAAAVYIVVLDARGVRRSTLVTAKSKVAPLKAVSLPRLELCGALLLARLLVKTQADLDDYQAPVYCWSDSQVVLAWLRGSPSSWKVFVANRVSEIQTSLPAARWGHVRSAQNPADHATRGLTPTQLQENQLWWSGPGQIFDEAMESQEAYAYDTTLEKRATTATFYTTVSEEGVETLLTRFSSMRRAVRVLSFVRRWKENYRLPAAQRPTRMIKAEELDSTRRHLIAAVQAHHFQKELALQRQGKPVHRTSSLRRLLPFLDPAGLLRVGGRLHYSFLGTDEKHPVIIPRNSHLAELLIRDAHRATLHGGPQLLQSHLCRTYWIPQARNKIRLLCRQCVQCCRFRGRTIEQQMAPLPSKRITPARPFSVTGVDYAGPFAIRTSKGRGQRSYKGYVAIFTCFVTRAVHIEVVSDYTSKTFIAAFKRFVARRGLCREVVSDNGTTFQGADSELRSLFQQTSSFSQEVAEAIQADGISWSYIPPRAPHFGGLWEAAVKSFKHHLKRVLGDATLTFEEFSTLTACIEACLNSRPLSPLSADPGDIAALTPGHFLTGAALTAPPEPSSDLNVIGLPRWKLVTQMHQHFWARWHKEVLHHLQQRSKWLKQDRRPAVGDLVLLTDDQLPPLKWPLARIEALHPGADGLPRVATLRTATSTLKRPLVKVVPLPINEVASAHHAALSAAST